MDDAEPTRTEHEDTVPDNLDLEEVTNVPSVQRTTVGTETTKGKVENIVEVSGNRNSRALDPESSDIIVLE